MKDLKGDRRKKINSKKSCPMQENHA